MTAEDAMDAIKLCDSYTRLPELLELWAGGKIDDATARLVLGDIWSICDNVGHYADELGDLLLPRAEPAMMTTEERDALRRLPAKPTIYRGADRGINERGWSWSRSRRVASAIPFLTRYRAQAPVLVVGRVQRSRIVAVKLDRGEAEVIVNPMWVDVLSVRPLAARLKREVAS